MTRIVVTGIGLVTPLGNSRESTWENLIAGRSGVAATDGYLEARVSGVSVNGAPRPITRPSYGSGRSRAGDFAVLVADEALAQAGLSPHDTEVGCAFGQSKPLFAEGGVADPALLLASFTGWSLESVVRAHAGLTGRAANVAAACATGVAAIETAASWIRDGLCDAAIAGAAEASLTPFYRAGFSRLGVLAEGTDPSAVRPFDVNRRGFAMGEGAAALVLESEDFCRSRGATPLACLERVALRQSSVDSIRFDDDGRDVLRLIRAVGGETAPDYINAHGTGTGLNDASEARGISRAFGANSAVRVGSTKASTGHLLGAAGAVEAAFAALTAFSGIVPPSLNIENPDPVCDFSLVRGVAQTGARRVMSLSYGFGGQMGGVLFERLAGTGSQRDTFENRRSF